MTLQLDRRKLDEFCPRLFRSLDRLGLLPRQLSAKPNEFEKYPRLLFGSIRRYNDVEAGFREWESRVLRDSPFRKEEQYPDLEALRHWMAEHADLLSSKANQQHLHTSLYARVFQYLYPRRVLVNAYCKKHQGNPDALTPEFIARELPGSVAEEVQKVQAVYQTDWDAIVTDARQTLLSNAAYYRKVLSGKEQVETAPDSTDKSQTNLQED